jgi:uncharacterized protein YraI
MRKNCIPAVLTAMLVAGCSYVSTDRAVVKGTGDVEFLNVRAGPGLGYNVIMGLPEGTLLNRHGCVTEVGQLWCEISLTDGSRTSGYVSADYLSAP